MNHFDYGFVDSVGECRENEGTMQDKSRVCTYKMASEVRILTCHPEFVFLWCSILRVWHHTFSHKLGHQSS
jgi:hypothetical protein